MQEYKKISEIAKGWGISERRINTLCLEGRIEGAEKPKDDRIKYGKYKNHMYNNRLCRWHMINCVR